MGSHRSEERIEFLVATSAADHPAVPSDFGQGTRSKSPQTDPPEIHQISRSGLSEHLDSQKSEGSRCPSAMTAGVLYPQLRFPSNRVTREAHRDGNIWHTGYRCSQPHGTQSRWYLSSGKIQWQVNRWPTRHDRDTPSTRCFCDSASRGSRVN